MPFCCVILYAKSEHLRCHPYSTYSSGVSPRIDSYHIYTSLLLTASADRVRKRVQKVQGFPTSPRLLTFLVPPPRKKKKKKEKKVIFNLNPKSISRHDSPRPGLPPTTMPSSLAPPSVKKKRKHAETKAALSTAKKPKPKPSALTQEGVLALEGAIVESAKHYNNIATLQTCFADSLDADADADADADGGAQMAVTAAVALCRTFCRLMAKGRLRRRKDDDPDAATVVAWLRERYRDYVNALCVALGHRYRVQVGGWSPGVG